MSDFDPQIPPSDFVANPTTPLPERPAERELPPAPLPAGEQKRPEPTLPQTLDAVWHDNNWLEAGQTADFLAQYKPQQGYDPFTDPLLKANPGYAGALGQAVSPEHMQALWHQIGRAEGWRQTVSDSGWSGVLASSIAALANPWMGAAMLAAPEAGMLRGALQQGGAAVAADIMQTQGDPNASPNIASVGLQTILGGATGGLFHRAFPGEAGEAMAARYHGEWEAQDPTPRAANDSGAAGLRDAGAAGTPGANDIAGERLKPTGLKLENLPDTPVKRGLMSESPAMTEGVAQLADTGGMTQLKNTDAFGNQATTPPVERAMRRYLPDLVQSIGYQDEMYLQYRGRLAETAPPQSDIGLWYQMTKTGVRDLLYGRDGALSPSEFRREVGWALHTGDQHAIPEVRAAAQRYRSMLDEIRVKAEDVEAFTQPHQRALAQLEERLAQSVDPAETVKLNENIDRLKDKIERINQFGPLPPVNADSYAPLSFDGEKIRANLAAFRQLVESHLRQAHELAADPLKLQSETDRIVNNVLRERSWQTSDPEHTGLARSLHERDLQIPIEDLKPYIHLDAEMLMRRYVRSMSADIELTRALGDVAGTDQIAKINQDYDRLMREQPGRAAEFSKARAQDLEDFRALRDRIRGTYGLPDDPYSLTASAVRAAKLYNYVTLLGGVTIASLPDIARGVMTEGLGRTWETGLKPLTTNLAALQLAMKEVPLAGEALDIVMHSRASAFTDWGDVLGQSGRFERSLHSASGAFSMLNLLNPWTDMMKSWTGAIAGSRIIEESRRWALQAEPQIAAARALADAETGQPIVMALHRGTGGDGRVGFGGRSVFGPGSYWAADRDVARQYGSTVQSGTFEASNPLVLRKDKDLFKAMREAGIAPETIEEIRTAKSVREALDASLPSKTRELPPEERAAREARVDAAKAAYDTMKRDAFQQMAASAKERGHDALIVHTGQTPFADQNLGDVLKHGSGHDQAVFFDPPQNLGMDRADAVARHAEIDQQTAQLQHQLNEARRDPQGVDRTGAHASELSQRITALKDEQQGLALSRLERMRARLAQAQTSGDPLLRGEIPALERQIEFFTTAQPAVEREKLARMGIDESMARRIAGAWEEAGAHQDGRLHIPNTPNWTDDVAREAFRSALVGDVNRAIVTPGVGDTPLWTSSQFGSLITQFKKFGMASTQRVLISGLQDRDAAFFNGALMLVGMGAVADYLKSAVGSDKPYDQKPWQERLTRAIDRGGILGWFADANNTIDRLSDGRVGLDAMLGQHQPYQNSFATKVGSVLGPTAQQAGLAMDAMESIRDGRSRHAAHAIRRLLPLQNWPVMIPAMNQLERAGSAVL